MRKNIVHEALHSRRGSVRYLEELRSLSRTNRNNPTDAERKIWEEILMKRKTGYKFLRQKPIYRFILDFYCSELNIAIEIDGDSHDTKKGYDESRDRYLRQIGIRTIRFTNDQIINNIGEVRQEILLLISPSLSREGD